MIQENTVPEMDGLAFIYSGLGNISTEGRKQLKNLAQSLVAIQNRPGVPVPDSICREILRKARYSSEKG